MLAVVIANVAHKVIRLKRAHWQQLSIYDRLHIHSIYGCFRFLERAQYALLCLCVDRICLGYAINKRMNTHTKIKKLLTIIYVVQNSDRHMGSWLLK